MSRVLLGVVALVAAAATGGQQAQGVGGRCAQALPRGAAVPAPIVVTTRCGRFRLQPKGDVVYKGRRTQPVPKGASYYPGDLTWWRFSHRHLLIGRGLKQLWRSHGHYRSGDVSEVVLGTQRLSFSYSGRLYVARYGGPEHVVARGEYPVAFLSGRLVAWRARGWALVLRGAGRVVVPHAVEPQWDRESGMIVFRTGHQLRAFDGVRVRELGNRYELGVRGNPVVELLGGLVSMHDTRRLVVLDYHGRVVASAQLPARPQRVDGVSSSVVANAEGTAFAFTATQGNTAYGSRGREALYVLQAGGHAVRAIFTEHLKFEQCERMAWLAWRGQWLLYASSEEHAAVVDGTGHGSPVELTGVIARLPSVQRDGPFDIAWAPAP